MYCKYGSMAMTMAMTTSTKTTPRAASAHQPHGSERPDRVPIEMFCRDPRLAKGLALEAVAAMGFTRLDAAAEFVASYDGANDRVKMLRSMIRSNGDVEAPDHCGYCIANYRHLVSGGGSGDSDVRDPTAGLDIDKFPIVRVSAETVSAFEQMGFGALAEPRSMYDSVREWEHEYTRCRALDIQINTLLAFANGLLNDSTTADFDLRMCTALISGMRVHETVDSSQAYPTTSAAIAAVMDFAREVSEFIEHAWQAAPLGSSPLADWARCVALRYDPDPNNRIPTSIEIQAARILYNMDADASTDANTDTAAEFDVQDSASLVRWRWPMIFANANADTKPDMATLNPQASVPAGPVAPGPAIPGASLTRPPSISETLRPQPSRQSEHLQQLPPVPLPTPPSDDTDGTTGTTPVARKDLARINTMFKPVGDKPMRPLDIPPLATTTLIPTAHLDPPSTAHLDPPPTPIAIASADPIAIPPTDPIAIAPTDPIAIAPTDPIAIAPTDPIAIAPTDPIAIAPAALAAAQPTVYTKDTRSEREIEIDRVWDSAAAEARELRRDERTPALGDLTREQMGPTIDAVADSNDEKSFRSMMRAIKEHVGSVSNASLVADAMPTGTEPPQNRKGLKLFEALDESQVGTQSAFADAAMPTAAAFDDVTGGPTRETVRTMTGGRSNAGRDIGRRVRRPSRADPASRFGSRGYARRIAPSPSTVAPRTARTVRFSTPTSTPMLSPMRSTTPTTTTTPWSAYVPIAVSALFAVMTSVASPR
jgi:hypothetical protein